MPVYKNRTITSISNDLIKRIGGTSPLRHFAQGSKIRALLEAFSAQLSQQYNIVNNNIKQSRPSEASKRSLDKWADLYNITRLRRTRAFASYGDLNVRFFVNQGTFGSLSSMPAITPGTVISTSDGKMKYVVTTIPGSIRSGASNYYVGVRAVQAGASFNVGSRALTSHSLGIVGLKVINDFPISNGRDDETDNQLRFRVFNAVRSLESANETAMFVAARSVPGVGAVKILPGLFGSGTTALLIRPTIGVFGQQSLIASVRTAINRTAPSGARIIVALPDIVGISMEIVVNYNKVISDKKKMKIGNSILTAVNRFFSPLGIGNSVNFGRLRDLILNVDPSIKSLGFTTGSIGRIWVHYSEGFGNTTSRQREEFLQGNNGPGTFSLNNFEIAALERNEGSSIAPVTIIHNT
tara:strand:- start:78347 stop:79576 length:1230 start_codon:yes stop_codon:yes gene_type:complete